jgi:ribosome-associated translation inhibitor RaiA
VTSARSGQDVVVDVHTGHHVPARAAARAAAFARRWAEAGSGSVRHATVVLSIDEHWPGERRHHVEVAIDTAGQHLRGFAAGRTFAEALDELDRTLRRRLRNAHAWARPAPDPAAPGPRTEGGSRDDVCVDGPTGVAGRRR